MLVLLVARHQMQQPKDFVDLGFAELCDVAAVDGEDINVFEGGGELPGDTEAEDD